ncbi:MAG: cytochrome d ubiquinol oxidase subunit II [Vicinamibacteraceae bacterium]|nr:cytochrome d ubiquinol oxidase subunit II [Vicinamibacteraceae bacterium]
MFDLNTLWFVLIAVLFIGFFVLEGFDYGVGILLPWLGKTDAERRRIINTIGPVWDGNEVWVITAGGAMFAAFPQWYATLFSGFYLALLLMLAALIVRAVGFEFRSKDRSPAWRTTWDALIFFGSLVPALLWGVALGNLLVGVPIDQTMTFTGGFLDLLGPYELIAGLATLSAFTVHGGIFLHLKSDEPIRGRALRAIKLIGPVATVFIVLFGVTTYLWTDAFTRLGVDPGLTPIVAVGCMLAAGALVHRERMGWAFVMTSVALAASVITIFMSLYPRVMVSSLNPDWTLTIYNAASTPYTLRIMSIVALVFVPIVLIYQGWTYWVFRHRITADTHLEY